MATRRERIEIRAAPEVIFDLVHDYGRRLEWDPFLKEAHLLYGATQAGSGISTLCVAKNGLAMETLYVTFHRPRVAAVKMTRGPMILDSFAASWRQKPLDGGVTEVLYKHHLSGRPRWLRWLLTPILCLVFTHDTRRRLLALKQAVEKAGSGQ